MESTLASLTVPFRGVCVVSVLFLGCSPLAFTYALTVCAALTIGYFLFSSWLVLLVNCFYDLLCRIMRANLGLCLLSCAEPIWSVLFGSFEQRYFNNMRRRSIL